jgi:[FeFe] hydrogenase H-cluster maturation GTPase HydF
VIVSEAGIWGDFEEQLLKELKERKVPVVAVFNKSDIAEPNGTVLSRLTAQKIPVVKTSAVSGGGILDFRQALLDTAPSEFVNNPTILSDLVGPGEMQSCYSIDRRRPRSPHPTGSGDQDLLDSDAYCMVVRNGNSPCFGTLKRPQAGGDRFSSLSGNRKPPRDIPYFLFILLPASGDLSELVRGTLAIDRLKPGDRVLIAEACSHHPIAEDIGRVKIPRWLAQYVGGKLEFDTVQGHDFPDDLSPFRLIIHCGACMMNRREMLTRLLRCRQAGVPVTNYGLTIAYSLGIFERALEPFPTALEAYQEAKMGGEGEAVWLPKGVKFHGPK